MDKSLLNILLMGDDGEREHAAVEICRTKPENIVEKLTDHINNHNPRVRETLAMVLGVIGGDEYVGILDEISKTDQDINVRIAAIIAKEHAGKTTFQLLKAEIKKFRGERPAEEQEEDSKSENKHEVKKAEPPVKKPKIRNLTELDKNDKKSKNIVPEFLQKRKVISLAVFFVIASSAMLYLFFPDSEESSVYKAKTGEKTLGEIIQDRISAIDDFKRTSLNPGDPASRLPQTLELPTIIGDTYGDLFLKVYSNLIDTEEGLNTIGAMWRIINFKEMEWFNDPELMNRETAGEVLLFPNFNAMHLSLDVEKGSVSYQMLNKADKDLEINIRVKSVIVK